MARTIETHTAELPHHGKALTHVKSILEEEEARAIDERNQEVIKWLSPLNFFAMQNETLQRRENGTATWILRDPRFVRWTDSTGGILCCPGIRM